MTASTANTTNGWRVSAWHDPDVKPEALLAAVYLAAITVVIGLVTYKLLW